MISFSCPGCQATFKLPDEMAGKTARCSKCNHRFTVPGGKAKPAAAPAAQASAPPPLPSPPLPPKKVALNPIPEVLEAEVIDEPVPSPRRPAQRAAAVDDVDEVEVVDEVQVVDEAAIQAPRRGRRPMPANDEDDDDGHRRPGRRDRDSGDRDSRGRDDWDDDDDSDRPRRKRRRERSGSSKMGVIMASIGGGAFVLMIVCFVGMILSAPPVVAVNQPFPNQPFPNQPLPFNPNPNFQPQQNQPAPANAVTILDKQDQLTANDQFDTVLKRSRSKRYDVQLQAGKTYTIEMIAVANQKKGILTFDPYLRLELNGNVVALNDDGAGNLNSRIVFRAQQTAQHVVIATSLNQLTGEFRLTVRESP